MEQTLVSDLKARLVADYFIARDEVRDDPDVTQMKLHKLMYFAQAHYLAESGCRLFRSELKAYQHGPMIEDISQDFREFGRAIIVVKSDEVANAAKLSAEELPATVVSFLDKVWQQYGDYSASQLRNMTHEERPWIDAWDETRRFQVIQERVIQSYYRTQISPKRHIVLEQATFVPESIWLQLEEEEAAL